MSGNQPYMLDLQNGNKLVSICNGEIYNYQQVAISHDLPDVERKDCYVLPLLYQKYDFEKFSQLFESEIRGEFAFIIFEFDQQDNLLRLTCSRDHIGVRPLYTNIYSNKDKVVFASQLQALTSCQDKVEDLEPGVVHQLDFKSKELKKRRFDIIYNTVQQDKPDDSYLFGIRESLIASVRMRLNADQPLCFLLSGGLDSSLICAIAAKYSNSPIHTFCCGTSINTNDMQNARIVAKHVGSIHTEVVFSQQEALEIIPTIVHVLGTYDVTTIRASIGQYFVCKHIKECTPFKVIMCGELADEVLCYLFGFQLSSGDQIDKATKRLVKEVHKYDVVRVDRIVSGAFSMEARLPFSDVDFIQACWQIPSDKRLPSLYGHGKYWLRKAFDHWLPPSVLWRIKSAFSDEIISNSETTLLSLIQELCYAKKTTERGYYIQLFTQSYGNNRFNVIEHYWQPILNFNENGDIQLSSYIDPSATTLSCFNKIKSFS